LKIYISQSSVWVVMQLKCGGIFNNHFIADFPHNKRIVIVVSSPDINQLSQWRFLGTQCSWFLWCRCT